ncbi:hypothetical protein PSPO01_02614 [Paraphaeosphaeria sporulosa]
MMYTRNIVLGVVAADIPTSFWRSAEMAPAPTSTAGLVCLDSCDCIPKLCTDDAMIKGTTTRLTYLCPETKTVQLTETIFVTVHEGESKFPVASTSVPSDDEKTTNFMITSKSMLFITKTVMSKQLTSSPLDETPISASNPLVSSSAAV